MIRVKLREERFRVKANVSYSVDYPYTGQYEFTPTMETQIVPIAGKKATENIIINPIPSNYGLITWDGSVLTVS